MLCWAGQGSPGNTLRAWLVSRLRSRVLAVMLKICRGLKFTPSFTWKLKPPDMAPGSTTEIHHKKMSYYIFIHIPPSAHALVCVLNAQGV